jgi:hypothetical protein
VRLPGQAIAHAKIAYWPKAMGRRLGNASGFTRFTSTTDVPGNDEISLIQNHLLLGHCKLNERVSLSIFAVKSRTKESMTFTDCGMK